MKYIKNVTTLRYSADACTGCKRCLEVCPRGVFVMENGKARVTDGSLCMECGACSLNCEFGVLHVDAGVGCAAAVLNGMITGGPPSCDCSGDSNGAGCC